MLKTGKKILCTLLVVVMCMNVIPFSISAEESSSVQFAGGDGTKENPYQVSTPEQLNAVRNDLSAYYVQINDIDMSDWGNWKPIGLGAMPNKSPECTRKPFTGKYDGQNYAITGLKIKDNVILPTCSEKGYTEYLCECGASYISDYVGMIAHSYVYSVVNPSSHLIEGLGRYTCSKCGDHYDESIAKTKEHSYTSTLVNSTCISQGYTLSECECGDSFKSGYLAKTDHNDSNTDGVCDNCGYELTANCSCNCHAGGIKGLIFKLILFFQKLFRMNRICEGCGVYHY